MASWCAAAGLADCLPWVGGAGDRTQQQQGYKAVSTHDEGARAEVFVEQSTTWADNTTLHLDGTVSAELLRASDVNVSTASNLDAKTEAWLTGACAALDDITASPLSEHGGDGGDGGLGGHSSDRSSLSADIAAALNGSVVRVMRAVSTTSAEDREQDHDTGLPKPSPRFSSHPSRNFSKVSAISTSSVASECSTQHSHTTCFSRESL